MITLFELFGSKNKFKNGDYVYIYSKSYKGIIMYNVPYDNNRYYIKTINGDIAYCKNYDMELLTPEEIEQYKFEEEANKYNL